MKLVTILLFICFTLLSSCLKREPASNEQISVGTSYMMASFGMDEKQLSYAYSFCSALRSHRHQMVMEHLGDRIHYTLSETGCDQSYNESNMILKVVNTKAMKLRLVASKQQSTQVSFDILTDKSKEISHFCHSILSGEEQTNELARNTRVEFRSISGSNSLDAIFLYIDGVGVIEKVKRYEVDVNPASETYGHTLNTFIDSSCADGGIHQIIRSFRFMD